MWPAATAPIRPLAWELPYVTSAALKKRQKEKMGTNNTCYKGETKGKVQHSKEPYALFGRGEVHLPTGEESIIFKS